MTLAQELRDATPWVPGHIAPLLLRAADSLTPLTELQIEHHVGPDEADREAVLYVVREVEALHNIK